MSWPDRDRARERYEFAAAVIVWVAVLGMMVLVLTGCAEPDPNRRDRVHVRDVRTGECLEVRLGDFSKAYRVADSECTPRPAGCGQ